MVRSARSVEEVQKSINGYRRIVKFVLNKRFGVCESRRRKTIFPGMDLLSWKTYFLLPESGDKSPKRKHHVFPVNGGRRKPASSEGVDLPRPIGSGSALS